MTEITQMMKIALSWLRGNPSFCVLVAIAILSAVVRVTQIAEVSVTPMARDLEAAA